MLVHEWNEPALVADIGALRGRGHPARVLFHDTHHRAVSAPDEIDRFDLRHYDGVLAFGRTLAEAYARRGWDGRVHVWHEAADIRLFKPPAIEGEREGLVWIGNWGDGERTRELETFLLGAAREAACRSTSSACATPTRRWRCWSATARATAAGSPTPQLRRSSPVISPPCTCRDASTPPQLPGIPTIRVFEALACGIPLVCAPWSDSEHLFTPGADYLVAADGGAMTAHLRALAAEPELRASLVAHGLATIRARHTCAHRARELLAIAAGLGVNDQVRDELPA